MSADATVTSEEFIDADSYLKYFASHVQNNHAEAEEPNRYVLTMGRLEHWRVTLQTLNWHIAWEVRAAISDRKLNQN